IERAVADLDAITAVFQALLRISEIEAGARRSAFVAMDTKPLLADLAELYGAVAEEKGVHLEVHLGPELRVRGDRELIQQAVANLPGGALHLEDARPGLRAVLIVPSAVELQKAA